METRLPPTPLRTTPSDGALDKRDWIAGLEKGLGIIETFDDANPRQTASQAGQRAGLTRTAARRYLLTLNHLGYVATDGKLFWLTPRVLRLGHSYLDSARLPRIALPFLQRVTAGTQEVAYVSVLDGDETVYVARNAPGRTMNAGFGLGARLPAQVTAAGMLMLAMRPLEVNDAWFANTTLKPFTSYTVTDKERLRVEFARIRAQGWSISEQQLDLGYRGVAVPLLDREGELAGGLNVAMAIGQESSEDAVARVLPVLQEVARTMRNLI